MPTPERKEQLQKLLTEITATIDRRRPMPKDTQLDKMIEQLGKLVAEVRQNKTVVNIPNRLQVMEPSWIERIKYPDFEGIRTEIKSIRELIRSRETVIDWPTKASTPIAVRLSDGEKFYEAITNVWNGGGVGNVVNIPKLTIAGGQQAIPIVNPDGSSIGTSTTSVTDTTDESAFTEGSTQGKVIMGYYSSTPDTLASGKAAAVAIDENRYLLVNLARFLAGEDTNNDVLKVEQRCTYGTELSADGIWATGSGVIHNFIYSCTTGGTIVLRDAVAAGAGTIIKTLVLPVGVGSIPIDASFGTGLFADYDAGTLVATTNVTYRMNA